MKSDGDACSAGEAQGTCSGGVCEVFYCGDGLRDGAEQCEGSDFGGMTCLDFGFTNPDGLVCIDCKIDKSACKGGCGDGVIDANELCDMVLPPSFDCTNLGYYDAGNLKCSPYCTFDVAGCTGFCGDGIVNGPEQCDHAAPYAESCLDFSFDRGRLGCTLCAPGFDGCDRFGWDPTAAPTGQFLSGIWGTASDDFYVVGYAGTILHYDGTLVSAVASPTGQNLFAIWGSAANDAFVVGNAGTVLHYDGTSFTTMTSNTTMALTSVWGSSSTDVYAVGAGGTIAHFNGNWSTTAPFATTLRGVWGSSANDVYAVGSPIGSNGTVLHYNGSSWTQVLPASAGIVDLYAVWGTGPSDVFVAGQDASAFPIVLHFNGSAWTTQTSPIAPSVHQIVGLFGTGAGEVFAVGDDRILHYDGTRWSQLAPGPLQPLKAIWASPDGEVWTAGNAGYVAHWSGASWTSAASGTASRLRGVWSLGPSDAWAVGDAGTIRHYDGLTWTAPASPTSANLFSVWSAGPSFSVAVGNGAIVQFDGTSWKNATCPASLTDLLLGVWGTAANAAQAVGFSGAAYKFDGSCWTSNGPSTADLYAVTGTSTSNMFASGASGANAAVRQLTTSWATVSLPPPALPNPLSGIWSAGPNEVFAVGDDILHLLGGVWSHTFTTVQGLHAVSGTSQRNVFAVGDNGKLLHYDGISWTPIRVPPPPPPTPVPTLRAVSATARSVLVVGDNGYTNRLAFSVRTSESNCSDGWDDDGDGMPDCADSDCASKGYCMKGGACPFITDLTCGMPVTSTTAGRTPGRDYYTCDASAETGPEAIYRITPANSGMATATLSGFGAEDLDLVVVGAMSASDACDPDFACLGASATTSGATETVQWNASAPRPYFIIVEGKNGAAGPFTLSVTCP